MKKYEILYDWISQQIGHISDSAAAEAFSSELEGHVLGDFVSLTEALRNCMVEIIAAKAGRRLLLDWQGVGVLLDRFGNTFPGFPGFHRNSLLAFCAVAGWLCANHSPVLDADNITEGVFEIRSIPRFECTPAWFVFENADQIENSLVVFSSRDVGGFESDLSSFGMSSELGFQFLQAIAHLETDAACPSALVKKSTPPFSTDLVESFVELHLAMAGLPTHLPRLVGRRVPAVANKDSVHPEAKYSQWSDVLLVLSEYNSRDELLIKYLTIYHVIENLMFKMPIVALERQGGGAMFTIRDFRRLYDSVSQSEAAALNKMFGEVFKLDAGAGANYQDLVCDAWQSFLQARGVTEVDEVLTRVGHTKGSAAFAGQNVSSNYATLVYLLRNSIVHNKETEFHLASQSLTSGMRHLIEDFLLPTLEQISFGVIGAPNDKLWYMNESLALC